MVHQCTYERIGNTLIIEVRYGDVICWKTEEDLPENDDLCKDVDRPEQFAIDDIEEADYAEPEFPLGLPVGYMVVTFYRGKGSNRKPLCSALFGRGGWMGTYGEPAHAVAAAIQLEEKARPEKGNGLGI